MKKLSKKIAFQGCLLGGAIGDSLGASIEFDSLETIRQKYGNPGLVDYDYCYGGLGKITDDTQMALFTMEGMLRARLRWLQRGLVHIPTVLYHSHLRWLQTQEKVHSDMKSDFKLSGWLIEQEILHSRRAPGNSCLSSLRCGKMGSTESPINNSKGCGGVMRIAPVGLILDNPFETACEIAALTHGHPTGYLSAAFLAELIYRLRIGDELRNAIETALSILEEHDHNKETISAINYALQAADLYDASPETVESLGAGWIAEEALAISLFCALKADNFKDGVLLAVNHSGDSDSTGAITGNILGLIHGVDAIPKKWIDVLEVRDIVLEMTENALSILELPSEDAFGWVNPDEAQEKQRRILLEKYPPN